MGETCDPALVASCPPGDVCTPSCDACVPPAVCGDSVLSPAEICDFTASPSGCTVGDVCTPDCAACQSSCGDGLVGTGEVCDGFLTCGPDEVCVDCLACQPVVCHDVCAIGPPLAPACDPCVFTVCTADPFCCNVSWDEVCADEAQTLCGVGC